MNEPIQNLTIDQNDKALCTVEGCMRTGRKELSGLCRRHHNEKMSAKKPQVPKDLAIRVGAARSTEDWQKIANELSPVIQSIADGTVKATAAQTAILKDIMNRAYGRPTAAAIEKRESAGVIILPALDTGNKTMICPKCGYDATATTVAT